MGSTQSTSEENYNSNATANLAENSDPWWPIESNENFTLEQPNSNDIVISDTTSDLNKSIIGNNNNNSSNNTNNNSDLNIVIKNNINLTEEISGSDINASETKLLENHSGDSILSLNESDDVNVKEIVIRNADIIEKKNLPPLGCSQFASNNSNNINNSKEQTLEEFKKELKNKRMARQTAISELRDEITRLRTELSEEREINKKLKNGETVVFDKMIDASVSTDDIADLNENAIAVENKQFETSLKDMVKQLQKDLAETHYNLQMTNSENLSLNSEVAALRKQVGSLKDVVTCSKQMIEVREEQVTQLKTKLTEIEESLADREAKLLSEDLRREYDKQMENIRNLRQLYEERARVCAAERENLLRQIQIKKDELAAEIEKTKNLEERISTFEIDLQKSQITTEVKRSECNRLKYENRELNEEMTAINLLFSQMLMGFNGNNCLDIDRLTEMLEQNRTLLNEMAIKEADCEGASLPKLLFDIVKQANINDNTDGNLNTMSSPEINPSFSSENGPETKIVLTSINQEQQSFEQLPSKPLAEETQTAINLLVPTVSLNILKNNNEEFTSVTANKSFFKDKNYVGKFFSAQEIIGNLPKVWRVIMELLNHQKVEKVEFVENGQSEECYKSIETPSGSKSELSVSKTYIKLKNLILEKKSLVKETNRLKTLNSHLEYRLNEQEKRLSAVSLELQKTWHLVGKMQRQHRQLHTHEQILRYQLQQKRRLLNELKEELEYCRRKWAAARAKNMESQIQCDDMRKEFARRRLEDSNNSAESGYSDGAGSGTDEEEREFERNHTRKIPPHKLVHDFIENSRILERRNSLSPTRTVIQSNLIRCQSAPAVDAPVLFLTEQITNDETLNLSVAGAIGIQSNSEATTTGAIPKQGTSRNQRAEIFEDQNDPRRTERTERIERLEEQCKSLIAKVLETSGCREKLELQIKRFQDEVPPIQHPVPLSDFIENTRRSKSFSPDKSDDVKEPKNRGQLTEREEEYTRRRSERIQRLENESKQLMSKLKRTNDRGSTIISRVRELHARCLNSREGSVDSSTDESEKSVSNKTSLDDKSNAPDNKCETSNGLSKLESCAERLKRLEAEGQMLLSKWTKNSERGKELVNKLDNIHSKYANKSDSIENTSTEDEATSSPNTELSRSNSHKTVEERLKEVENKANSRNERLKQMELESRELITKLTKTSDRGSSMIDHLTESRERRNSLRREQEKLKKEKQNSISEDELSSASDSKSEEVVPNETLPDTVKRKTGAKPKVKTLPKTGIAALTLSRQNKQKEPNSEENKKSNNSESLEEMFMRLSGHSSQPGTSSTSGDVESHKKSTDSGKTDERNDDDHETGDKN